MKIFISVISHGHQTLIPQLSCLENLSIQTDMVVLLKNNCPLADGALAEYCNNNGIHFIDQSYGLGFGENNNYVFDYAVKNLSLTDDDHFLVLNPDVYVEASAIIEAVNAAQSASAELSTINLCKDQNFETFDYCVRDFPSVIDFFSSYAGMGNKTIIDKSKATEPMQADWAAGSFLLFKASLYRKLGGFDPGYFMYCEDIDICWRAQKLCNQKLLFNPNIKAIHHAQHANRSLFSKHFLWHLKSVFRYLLMHYGLRKPYQS